MATTHTQLVTWADEYVQLRNEMTRLEARMKHLKEQMMMNVPKGEKFILDGRTITHSVYTKTSLNTALLKEKEPAVYGNYLVVKEEERLTVL